MLLRCRVVRHEFGRFFSSLQNTASCDVYPSAKHLVMIYTCLSVLSHHSVPLLLNWKRFPCLFFIQVSHAYNPELHHKHMNDDGTHCEQCRLYASALKGPGPRMCHVKQILGGHTFTVMLLMVKKLLEASRRFTAFLPRCCDYSWSQIPHETLYLWRRTDGCELLMKTRPS